MLGNITSFVNGITTPQQVNKTVQLQALTNQNPFVNPFISSNQARQSQYAKNKPVFGGYFAGYHNGQPNIVGRKLFIEA